MDKAWTTGITVCHIEDGWYASCDWKFGKHMESGFYLRKEGIYYV